MRRERRHYVWEWRRDFPPDKSQGHFNWKGTMSTPWTGRCLYGGAVQYEARGTSLAQLVCHCLHCSTPSVRKHLAQPLPLVVGEM